MCTTVNIGCNIYKTNKQKQINGPKLPITLHVLCIIIVITHDEMLFSWLVVYIALFIHVGLRFFMKIVSLGLGRHWWFNYLGSLLDVELRVYLFIRLGSTDFI